MATRTVVAVVAAIALVGCGGSGSGTPGRSVRFLVFGDPEEIQAYRTLVAAYEEQEGARVQLVEASDRSDLIARLSTSIAAGTPPDVFLLNYRFYGQFAAKGALEPLEDRIDDSETFDLDEFYDVAIDAFRWEGVLMCLPQNISSLVVYYNVDLFEQYGGRKPRPGWTWNEMLAAAQALTVDAQGRPIRAGDPDTGGASAAIYGLGVEASVIRIAPFAWSNGGELVDDPDHPTRFTLETPEALTALAAFLDLRSAYGVVPSDVEVEAEDDESRFAHGRLAMLLSSRRSTPTFRTITDFEWDVAPLPVFREPAGILHSDAYCIPRASDRKEDAWSFVEFANSPEGQEIVARTGRTVPSLIEVSRSEAFLDPSKPPRSSRIFLDGIEHIRRVPTISTWPEIEDAAAGVLENGLYLGQPADQVAEELDRVTRPLFARAAR